MSEMKRPLLNYCGGKWAMADWIISHFPEHKVYVEVFGGGLSVFMRKPHSNTEIVNDFNGRLFKLYKSLRDASDHLNVLLEMTPFSRDEYNFAKAECDSSTEEARRALAVNWFGISGVVDKDQASGFRVSKKANHSKAKSFKTYIENFWQFHERIRDAYIENLDWKECLKKFDDKDVLFYLDPPYVKSTRVHQNRYKHEMVEKDHLELVEVIQNLKGMAVLSGYESDVYKNLNWESRSLNARIQGSGTREEKLWLCPKTVGQQKQMGFDLNPDGAA